MSRDEELRRKIQELEEKYKNTPMVAPAKAAKVVCKKDGKPVLHLSLSNYDMNRMCLQAGKQPTDIFTIVLYRSGEF